MIKLFHLLLLLFVVMAKLYLVIALFHLLRPSWHSSQQCLSPPRPTGSHQ